jgi:membrane-associated protein
VGVCVGAGYFFGGMEVVKNNFELVVEAIVVISAMPLLWGYLINRMRKNDAAETGAEQ